MEPSMALLMTFYVMVILLVTFLFCFADKEADGVVGVFSRFFLAGIPSFIQSLILSICGDGALRKMSATYNYVANERNPLLQIGYLCIINGAFMVWIIYGIPQVPMIYLPTYHVYLAYFGVFASQVTFYLACKIGPGRITPENAACFGHEPYDGLLYTTNLFCKTCKVPKTARSKHCRLCGYCVPILDHHCIWLNQCVGELNYRYFILFLAVNAAFFVYGGYVCMMVIASFIDERKLFDAIFIDSRTGQEFRADFWMVFYYVLNNELPVFIVAILAIAMGIAISGFLGYHIYLMIIGKTTNETFKWSMIQRMHYALIDSHQVYLRNKATNTTEEDKTVKKDDNTTKKDSNHQPDSTNNNVDKTMKNRSKTIQSTELPQENQATLKVVDDDSDKDGDEFIGCLPPGFSFQQSGKKYKKQFVREWIDKYEDADDDFELPQELSEDPGPIPTNIYNIGFFKTFHRVIFPVAERNLRALQSKVGPENKSQDRVKESEKRKNKKKDK